MAGSAALPSPIEQLLSSVDASLDAVEAALDPYLAGPLKHLVTQLPPIDNARLNTSLAFSSASLLYAFLRLGGADPRAPTGPGSDPHGVMEEVAAVKRLFGRVDEAAKQQARASGQTTSRLDLAAAGRFIKAGLQGDDGAPPAASSSSASGSHVAAGPGRPGNAAGFSRKRTRDEDGEQGASEKGGDTHVSSASAGAAPAPPKRAGGAGEGSHRSTPQPALQHLAWKDEMDKRFKSKR